MKNHEIKFNLLPPHMIKPLQSYIEFGCPPGSFLYAILSKDFFEAVFNADDINIRCLRAYALWLHNEAPDCCWGSAEIVDAWIDRGGRRGVTNCDSDVTRTVTICEKREGAGEVA